MVVGKILVAMFQSHSVNPLLFTEYCNITLKVSGVSFREVLLLIRKSILNTDSNDLMFYGLSHTERKCVTMVSMIIVD